MLKIDLDEVVAECSVVLEWMEVCNTDALEYERRQQQRYV
jgi:hypothetical protein